MRKYFIGVILCGALSVMQPPSSEATNPIDCISAQGLGLTNVTPSQATYSMSVQFNCTGGTPGGLIGTISLTVSGLTVGNSTQGIYANSYGQTINFTIYSPHAGTYLPTAAIYTSSPYGVKTVYLPSFVIQAPQSSTPTPTSPISPSAPTDQSGENPLNNILNAPIPTPTLQPLNKDGTDWLFGQDIFGYSCWKLSNLKTAPQLQIESSNIWKTVAKGTMVKDLNNCSSDYPIRVTYHWKVNIYGPSNPNSPHEQQLSVREFLPKNAPYNHAAIYTGNFTKGMFPSRMEQIAAYFDVMNK